MELVQLCNGETEVLTPYAAVMAECFVIAQRTGNITFQHCPRDANKVAHSLARHAYDSIATVFWDGDPPMFIMPLVINDVTINLLQ